MLTVSVKAADNISIIVNGKPLQTDSQPFTENGRIMVPLRAIFEALNAQVDWKDSTKTITAIKQERKVTLSIGSKEADVSGRKISLDTAARMIGDRTFVPLRFVSEALGAEVSWNEAAKTALIKFLDKEDMEVNQLQNDFVTIRQRLIDNYIKIGRWSTAQKYLNAQDFEGKWTDVSYDDISRTNWLPLKHLNKVFDMAIAYKDPDSKYYKSEKMLDGIKKGLEYWYQRKPTSDNWWQIQIGQQNKLGPILLMLQNELSEEMVSTGAKYLYDPTQVKSSVTTGQNLVWFATETIQRGLINYNEADVKLGLDYIKSEIKITTGEGIQPDFSFYQHGTQLYNGGYGLGFIDDTTDWISVVLGTNYAFEKDKIDILSGLLLDGDRWMVRGKSLDPSVQGREPSRKGNSDKARRLLPACDILASANPERAKEFGELKSHINAIGTPNSISGNKFFWRTDYMTQQRVKYFTSVKMVSARTIGTELINNENLKGFWLPFGLTYIFQRGDEYNDIYPVWDWARLPGVTSPYYVWEIKSRVYHDEKFVGGVSDGNFGVATMSLNKMATTAKKSWFFFDDEFVALGTGITSTDENPVGTTLNQCLLNGSVLVDGNELKKGEAGFDSVSWVLHDGVGYVLSGDQSINIKAGPQTGSWKSVNDQYAEESISKDVFTLWLDHGVKPVNESYQYIVVPGTDVKSISEYASHSPIRVIANTTDLQAVRHEILGVTEIVFYAPSTIEIRDGLNISVDKPCMVIINENGNAPSISVSNPLSEAANITVGVNTATNSASVSFDLPGGGMAGSSMTKNIEIK